MELERERARELVKDGKNEGKGWRERGHLDNERERVRGKGEMNGGREREREREKIDYRESERDVKMKRERVDVVRVREVECKVNELLLKGKAQYG